MVAPSNETLSCPFVIF